MYYYLKLFFLGIYYFGYLLSASEKEISLVLEDNFGEMSYEAKDDMAYNGGDYNWDILDVNYKYTNYSSNNFRIQILDGNRISSISFSFGTCDRIIKTNETDEYASVDFYLSEVDNKGNFKDNWENVLWSNCYNSEQKLIIYQWKTTYLHLPNDYKTKLVNRYGEDWKTPQDTKGPNPPKEII